MNKETRNAIERATQRARRLLEEDFAAQLEGDFDVHLDGVVAAQAGAHLSTRKAFQRERIVAAIEHKRAAGMGAADAVSDYLRDAAFTTLNRFVALKMLEARGLVQECITNGEQSAGYREFYGMAPGLPLLPDSMGYRLYLEALFDELSTEVKVLFDRRDPSSVLWPKRATFEKLLEILNLVELGGVWGEDETIGWVYQFFNGQDERRKMREESQTPRDSRELAVRNQFFTPRYVVQFLTDNTLGRIWYEMRCTRTTLAQKCEYMVRKPDDNFPFRAKKDPRDLRVLDPACGSGHFLLYAFDLLLTIYEEAYGDPESPRSGATGKTLAEDYSSVDALRNAVPGLVLAHNLHGVDIDPRCAQIAQLALWMRAQKAYRDFNIGRAERAQIRRSNIVVAEPLVADEQIAKEFVAKLRDPELAQVFKSLVGSLSLAGDLGLLLRLEQLVIRPANQGQVGDLLAPPEELIRAALVRFVGDEALLANARRRLFLDDAAHGVALLGLAETKFDVVLMNPPFGAATEKGASLLSSQYNLFSGDILTAFVSRAHELCPDGLVGGIYSRAPFFLPTAAEWRLDAIHGRRPVSLLCDLGAKVLDAALVEAMALVMGPPTADSVTAIRLIRTPVDEKSRELRHAISALKKGQNAQNTFFPMRKDFAKIEGAPLVYSAAKELADLRSHGRRLGSDLAFVEQGLSTKDDFRFLRLWWEVSSGSLGQWAWLAKGGEYRPFYSDLRLLVRAQGGFRELDADLARKYPYLKGNTAWVLHPESHYLIGGITYPERTTSGFGPRLLPSGAYFSHVGLGVIPRNKNVDALQLTGWLMSRAAQMQVELQVGSADAVESGSAARHYSISAISSVVFPREISLDRPSDSVLAVARLAYLDCAAHETSPLYAGIPTGDEGRDFDRYVLDHGNHREIQISNALSAWNEFEAEMEAIFGIPSELLEDEVGRRAGGYPRRDVDPVEVLSLLALSMDALVDSTIRRRGPHRAYSKKSFVVDRRFELVCAALEAHPESIAAARRASGRVPPELSEEIAQGLIGHLVGVAFGRFRPGAGRVRGEVPALSALFEPHSLMAPGMAAQGMRGILVDDEGHADDLLTKVRTSFDSLNAFTEEAWLQLWQQLCEHESRGRAWLAKQYFARHIARYSDFRRKAPIYWQLATPSASYSVWIYIHSCSKDTLFRIQTDYVSPKLEHEERRLEAIKSELRGGGTASQRKVLADQGAFVDELRELLDEVKRVAPLWKPNLDDGVVINFAPLWRLVPHNRSWQKELKATWDALCDGEYDWAHLAMHLWPERVVPKCAKDRSLAIAHGVEDIFWIKASDGGWTARNTPTESVEDLVRERTSPAVKSALNSLLQAPATIGKRAGRKSARRRDSAGADGVGK